MGGFFNASAARCALRLYFMAFFRALCSEPINYTARAAPLKIAGEYRAKEPARRTRQAGQAGQAGRAASLSRAASPCAWARAHIRALMRGALQVGARGRGRGGRGAPPCGVQPDCSPAATVAATVAAIVSSLTLFLLVMRLPSAACIYVYLYIMQCVL